MAVQVHRARARHQLSKNGQEERGFPAPVGSDDADEFTSFHAEVDVVQDLDAAPMHGHVLKVENRRLRLQHNGSSLFFGEVGWLTQLRLNERRNEPSDQEKKHAADEKGREDVGGMHLRPTPSSAVFPSGSTTQARLKVLEVLVHQGQVVVAVVHWCHFHGVEREHRYTVWQVVRNGLLGKAGHSIGVGVFFDK